MTYVIQTEAGRHEITGKPLGVQDSAVAFCELVTDWKPVPLDIEQAQQIARQDFRRSLQEEHKGGCDDCFWKAAGHVPCDSLCCQLAVFGIERGVDIRMRGAPIEQPQHTDVVECMRRGFLFSATVLVLIGLHNAWIVLSASPRNTITRAKTQAPTAAGRNQNSGARERETGRMGEQKP